MRCKYCDKETVFNTSVCDRHGAHRIRYGSEAPNFKNGDFSKSVFETRKQLRMLTFIGNKLGFLKRKLRGRKILIQGEKI